MSALDKLDASLLDTLRFIGTETNGRTRDVLIEQLGILSFHIDSMRAELAAPVLPESYPDPGEKTLRDELAMHAPDMPDWVADHMAPRGSPPKEYVQASAVWKYLYADTMLAARVPPP